MFRVVWSEIIFILVPVQHRPLLHSPSTALTFRNWFCFATIVETMDFADEDSDYSEEASDEVSDGDNSDGDKNSEDICESHNSNEINDGTNDGIISKFCAYSYTNLSHCLLTYCCLSSLQFTPNPIKSISLKLSLPTHFPNSRLFLITAVVSRSRLVCGVLDHTAQHPKAISTAFLTGGVL
jgi:hypothetical protein